MRLSHAVVSLCLASGIANAQQSTSANRFAVVAGYSNDSSHIILGNAQDRKFAFLGIQYDRILLRRGFAAFAYQAEWRPVVVTSDPLARYTDTIQRAGQPALVVRGTGRGLYCHAGTTVYAGPDGSVTEVLTCEQAPTFGQSLSPVGFRFNALPHSGWQPVISGSAGFLLTTRPVPLEAAGSFNFLFDFGVGVERFTANGRSWRAEYLVQHYSNKYTADLNPGVDSGIFKVSYVFGR